MGRSRRVSKRSLCDERSQSEAASVAPVEHEAESSQSTKRRGPTKCIMIQTVDPNSRLPLEFDDFYQPIGPNTNDFQSYLSLVARKSDLCPIDIPEWDAMSDSLKDTHFHMVESKFSYTIPREEMQRVVGMSIGKKWRDQKSILRKRIFNEKLPEEEKRPEYVDPTHWRKFVEFVCQMKDRSVIFEAKKVVLPKHCSIIMGEKVMQTSTSKWQKLKERLDHYAFLK